MEWAGAVILGRGKVMGGVCVETFSFFEKGEWV